MFLIVKKDSLIVHGTFDTEKEALKYINNDTKKFGLVCLGEPVINTVCEINNKRSVNNQSVISELNKEQKFYLTIISRLMNELVDERIITPTQRNEITFYMFNKSNIRK